MITKNKEGTYYLNVLEPTLNLVNTAGELDRVALINSAMEGPVVASSGWQSQVGFNTATATVYRNGGESTLSAVQNQDCLLYTSSLLSCNSGKLFPVGEIVNELRIFGRLR